MLRDFTRPVTPLGYKFILDDATAGSAPQAPAGAGQPRPRPAG
jgi:hypothetical protein